ncbi:MAG TPA: 23S rRNA (uracil(1939)-C(5))-methyltransferase RlmD [Polyangia bacterium]
MKPGAELRVAVTELDSEGAGVGEIVAPGETVAPLEVRIPGVLPGEEVTARIEHLSSHRPVAWATFQTLHRLSPERVAPTCAAYGRCGGCVLQHFDYPAQVAWKERAFRKLVAAQPLLADVPVTAAVASPAPLGYRNKSKLVAGSDRAGRLVLGAYAPRTHDVVDLAGCAIAEAPLDALAAQVRTTLEASAVPPYDERRLVGTLRYVILRASATGGILLTLVTATESFPERDALVAALGGIRPALTGIVQNVNPTRGNAIFGTTQLTLGGQPTIDDAIGDVRLCVSSQAFLQANRGVAALAYAAIAAAVVPAAGDVVVDAYAGVGGIALTLAPRVGRVVGIEEHAAAVDDAVASAALNGITNATFVVGDVADRLAEVGRADIVVLNPPRKGCARVVLDRTAALGPRVIAYLSCAPETLLRDLSLLHGLGYRTRHITPFDMLPHTPHLEALAILDRV